MVILDGSSLTIEKLVKIAIRYESIELTDPAKKRIQTSHQSLLSLAQSEQPIYGVNTGFGIFADKRITKEQSETLNRNLIYSHAVATGDPLSEEIVRAAIAIRVNALAKGVSGIQYAIVELLINLLNQGITPYISSKGSLGSSGDLCLLAQLGLVILGPENRSDMDSGKAFYNGTLYSGNEVLKLTNLHPVIFSHKDGLALINGATFSTALAALSVYKAKEISDIAECSTAMAFEALKGRRDALDHRIHALRNMQGQMQSAEILNQLLAGSEFIDNGSKVQDAYSLRCAPQVHGAVRDTITYTESILANEVNAATDNPLMVSGEEIISGGNFHGEPIGLVADFLSIAISEIGAISERRIFRLMDKNLSNGLPGMLVANASDEGVNSGVMILQYTAAALALENQTYATPDSTKSLPTSANQEDHNANSYNAALHLSKIIENTYKILAIELFVAARACYLRKIMQPDLRFGAGTEKIFALCQSHFPYRSEDRQWREDLEVLYQMMLQDNGFKSSLLSIVN